MQQQSLTPAGARSLDRQALLSNVPFAVALRPPPPRCAAAALSGRPTCRIYARGDVWILEIESPSGGWLVGGDNAGRRLLFPNLGAAVAYAERHGLDYRIEPPRRQASMKRKQRRLPRSWMARLAQNGRKGDIYHG